MEILHELEDYRYPVIQNPESLKANARKIASILDERYPGEVCLIGTGTSGAMIIASILMIQPRFKALIIRKIDEPSHRNTLSGNVYELCHTDATAVVVDDMVSSGATIRRISEALELNGVLHKVKVLSCCTPCGMDTKFPNLDLLIRD